MSKREDSVWMCGLSSRLNEVLRQGLYRQIKCVDFLVMDNAGTHRAVGLRYDKKTMWEPQVTLVCMRHEMVMAKQIAFSLGTKIFYDSEVSAMLFRYAQGDFILPRDYRACAALYAKVSKNHGKPFIRIGKSGICINGKTLPPFFTVCDLTAILGKPDRTGFSDRMGHLYKYTWDDWGLRAYSCRGMRGLVLQMRLSLKKNVSTDIPPCLYDVRISKKSFSDMQKDDAWFYSKDCIVSILFADKKGAIHESNYDDVALVLLFFCETPPPLVMAMIVHRTDVFYTLLTKGRVNKRDRLHGERPLSFAVRNQFSEYVRPLLEHGANVNAKDALGFTALDRAVATKNAEIERLLREYGAVEGQKSPVG